MERVLLASGNGREAAIATLLAEQGESELHIAVQHRNPTLLAMAELTGGRFYSANIRDPEQLADIAAEARANVVWINQDNALADNAIGAIRRRVPDIESASPDSEAARIEWDKFDSREIVAEIDREFGTSFNPLYFLATTPEEVDAAINFLRADGIEGVVKPRGLTGGKGVKVMGPHFQTYEEMTRYAKEVISNPEQGGVVIEEKMEGEEFNIQGLTDGLTLIRIQETFDYPYREDGDRGPGTGGTGSFTMPGGEHLPFVVQEDYDQAIWLMEKMLAKLEQRGRDYKGTFYASFFKTPSGLKLVEINARLGCPEGMNVMELIDRDQTSILNVIQRIARRELRSHDIRYKKDASTALYLFSPDYAYEGRPARTYEFELDIERVKSLGCRAYFAASEQIGPKHFRTVGNSRSVAIATTDSTPWDARAKIRHALQEAFTGPLHYRNDVADFDFIQRLVRHF